MASFIDAISQFNPYVAQLPVDAMAKVGMQKQAQYEQGVQKIQAYIDNIAGMDIAHDSDKSYLQSKMTQLNSNLKMVAGGDFSNSQLVNSVGGMTTQIVKDPNIQNAVASTAWYKKQKQKLDEDYQSGKSSIANVKDFERQASAWLSNDKIGQNFKGKYSPYTDLSKKWNEVIKTIHPNASSEDFAYENFVDSKGKVHSDKLAAAMTRITKEGVSSSQIENAIRSSLTPDDMNQMRIDAAYRFEGVDSGAMKTMLTSNYAKSLEQLDATEKMITQAVNVVSGDPVQQEFAKTTLKALSDKRLKIKQNLQKDLAQVDSDLEGVKTNLYKEGFIDQTSSAFSWEKKAKELLTNPLLQAQFEQDKINIDKASLSLRQSEATWNRFVDVENLKLSREKINIDRQKALDDKYGVANGFTTLIGTATEQLLDPVSAINEDVNLLNKSVLQGKQALGGGNVAVADSLIGIYKNDITKVTPDQADDIIEILKNQQLANIKKQQLTVAENTVLEKNPSLRKEKESVSKLISSGKPINIVDKNGERITFNQTELFDFASKNVLKYIDREDRSGNALKNAARKIYTPKEYLLFSKSYEGTTQERGIVNGALNVYEDASKRFSTLSSNLNSEISTHLSTTNGSYIPAVTGIVVDTKSRPYYETVASTALTKYYQPNLGVKGGSAMLSADDASTATKWLSDKEKENIQYKKLNYAGKQSLVLTKDGESIIIPLSVDQEMQLPKLTGEANAFNEDINQLQIANGNYSTNPTNDIDKSKYQPWNMQTKGLNVYADLKRPKSNPNGQYINLYLKNKQNQIYPLQIDQKFNDASSADEFIRGLTNKDIKELYLSNPNTPESWKEQIKNL
jgi:hypothetical protein